jgi:excisionase family DNA binding protein
MVQGYYTLDEAARILGVSADELKQMSKRGELRAFQDRGTLRFRTQDVEERARQQGHGSADMLPLGDVAKPKPADSPMKKPKDDVFNFALDLPEDQVPIGHESPGPPPTTPKKKTSKVDPKKPISKLGPDSDVRLVAEGDALEFSVGSDSDVKIVGDSGPRSGPPGSKPPSSGPKSPAPPKRRTGALLDSKERLVDIGTDSDIKMIMDEGPAGKPHRSSRDSEIRLEPDDPQHRSGKGTSDSLLTEEIDLDAEIRKAEEAARAQPEPAKSPPRAKAPEFPTTSPFELSEADFRPSHAEPEGQVKSRPASSDDAVVTPERTEESSSDFELTPTGQAEEPPLDLGSDEFELEVDDNAVGLGDTPAAKGPASGINLQDPADSGISLEEPAESDEIEFELSLDAEATPKPAPAAEPDSDSEFELTIDESGGLAPLEPQAADEEKDIFETDFDVPALEEESGSEAVALDEVDTDLDSSDFDIALSETDMASEDESGSQVVALEEEEAEPGARTVQRPRPKKRGVAVEEEEGIGELMEEAEEEEVEEEEEPVAPAAVAAPAPEWGPLPVIFLLPCLAVLVLVGLMGFEMLQSVTGYHKPGPITKQVAKLLGQKTPD